MLTRKLMEVLRTAGGRALSAVEATSRLGLDGSSPVDVHRTKLVLDLLVSQGYVLSMTRSNPLRYWVRADGRRGSATKERFSSTIDSLWRFTRVGTWDGHARRR